jgi:cytochrome P450
MSSAPIYNIDLPDFTADPYPDLKNMRSNQPISYVPQLGATLITLRDDISVNEKLIETCSSHQPDGLMSKLMGTNMMRKDGHAHMLERRAVFPSFSPKTVRDSWQNQFIKSTAEILNRIESFRKADIVKDFAMPVSAEALKVVTGLTNMSWNEMDRVSQGMMDGIANYQGDPEIEENCKDCTSSIDKHIDEILPTLKDKPDSSLISVQLTSGLNFDQLRANVKLAISGGQNEPRDAISGTTWALLKHPEQLKLVKRGDFSWLKAFEEFGRWISPIGMSPRRVEKKYRFKGVDFHPDDRVFFMFGSANRDELIFDKADNFNIKRDVSASITFGAGPHFCAGAWVSKSLISEVALPMLFERFPNLSLEGNTKFMGWAFRGPIAVNVTW